MPCLSEKGMTAKAPEPGTAQHFSFGYQSAPRPAATAARRRKAGTQFQQELGDVFQQRVFDLTLLRLVCQTQNGGTKAIVQAPLAQWPSRATPAQRHACTSGCAEACKPSNREAAADMPAEVSYRCLQLVDWPNPLLPGDAAEAYSAGLCNPTHNKTGDRHEPKPAQRGVHRRR